MEALRRLRQDGVEKGGGGGGGGGAMPGNSVLIAVHTHIHSLDDTVS
jgi:GTPase involved in cell partitioning and DNA repair